MKQLWSGLLFLFFATNAHAQVDILYENSEGTPLLQVINAARSTIDIEIYEMQDLQVLQALQNAVQRGVKLRVVQNSDMSLSSCKVFDPVAAGDSPECVAAKKLVPWVRQNRGAYVPYNIQAFCPAGARYCFQHGKILIADSKVALVSTGNYNASNLCDHTQHTLVCNRDYTVLTRDPNVIRTLGYIFQFDLEAKPYDLTKILSTPLAKRLTVSPYSLAPLVHFIESAKSSILIQNQYLDDPTLNQALIDAAKRGVQVYVNVVSACYYSKPVQADIDRWTHIFGAFDQAGIQSRMFTESMSVGGVHGYLHAKVILIDGKYLWVGSVNGSTQSLTLNREFGLFLNEPEAIHKFAQKFDGDFKHPYSESWQEGLSCKFDHPRNQRFSID